MNIHQLFVKKFCDINNNMEIKRNKVRKEIKGLTKHFDIPYIDDGNKYHLLDIFYPENTEKALPIIFDIHGGAWIYGTKEINAHYCQDLASRGFVVVNISYRLITEDAGGTFPNCVNDIFAALNWVEKNISQYHGDINNIMITGDSAGGHLAAMTTNIIVDEKLREKLNLHTGIKLRALTLTCAVTDLEKYEKIHLPIFKYLFERFFGADWKKSEFKKYGTIRNGNLENFPPILLISSYGDFMKKQVIEFDKELTKRDIEHELCYFDKKKEDKLEHVFNVLFPQYKESIIANDKTAEFFAKYIV